MKIYIMLLALCLVNTCVALQLEKEIEKDNEVVLYGHQKVCGDLMTLICIVGHDELNDTYSGCVSVSGTVNVLSPKAAKERFELLNAQRNNSDENN